MSGGHNWLVVCLQAGHLTKKNKKCPMYKEEEPEIMAPWLPDLNLPHPPMQVSTPPYRALTQPSSCMLLRTCIVKLCMDIISCIFPFAALPSCCSNLCRHKPDWGPVMLGLQCSYQNALQTCIHLVSHPHSSTHALKRMFAACHGCLLCCSCVSANHCVSAKFSVKASTR